MLKNLIVLPDGTEVASGREGAAIRRLSLTQTVNSGKELTLGSACAAMLEVSLQLPSGVSVKAGDPIKLFRVDEAENRYQMGIFLAGEPQHRGSLCSITAYDRMTLFDRDLSSWLASLSGWPYTLQQLTDMVCRQCGVELATPELPNGALTLQPFKIQGVTGRQLLEWIGEITGRFCRMNPLGQLEFGWYTPAQLPLGPTPEPGIESFWEENVLSLETPCSWDGDNLCLTAIQATGETGDLVRLEGRDGLYYYPGTLSLADYAVAPVDSVQLQQTDTLWPQGIQGNNTYIVADNPVVAALLPESLNAVAKGLYELLRSVSYIPCRVKLPADLFLEPGRIVTVTDRSGRIAQTYLMTAAQTGCSQELESTGSASRGGTPVLRTFRDLNGKVLRLGADVEGIRAENRDTQGNLAALELNLEGIRTRVEGVQESQDRLGTEFSQTADAVSVFINRVETEGIQQVTTRNGYTFSERGLQIQRSGESVQSLLTHTGLQVTRDGVALLQADKDGVRAVDVTVGNYLILGEHARLEDYPGSRTACYYI